MIRSTGVWSVLLVFACGVTLAAEEPAPRALGSPHYVLELPSLASPADVTRGERLLETLERFVTRLDAEFVKAGVTKKHELPKASAVTSYQKDGAQTMASLPVDDPRWPVLLTRDRAAMVQACRGVPAITNTQGTAHYSNGSDGFLGVVASADELPPLKTLMSWSARQHLFRRAGVYYSSRLNPAGACVPEGYTHFLSWSHVRDGDEAPVELGGIGKSYGDGLRRRLAEEPDSYPTLEALFALTRVEFRSDKLTNYGAAVLFTEFMWDYSEKSRRAYIRALAAYGKSGTPVVDFDLETLVKHTRAIFGNAEKLDAAYRAFVIDRSAAINARKLGEKADAVK